MGNIPQPTGPYVNKRETNDLLFISGQLPVDPNTGQLIKDFENACRRSLQNIQNILEDDQLTMNSIVKIKIFTTQLENMAIINEVFEDFFKEKYPARSAIEVAKLPKNAVIEIEAIAQKI